MGEDAIDEERSRPVLRVVRGEPTTQELAALVAVVAALGTGSPRDTAAGSSAWVRAARDAGLRRGLRAGPGAWRDAVRPGPR